MKRYSKIIIAGIIALIFIGTFVFLYQKSQPQPGAYNEFTPKVTNIDKTTIITGKIEPRNEVEIKPQISGIITNLYKQAGDYVQSGEVIAKVKVIPDMSQLSSAQSRVRLADVNMKQSQVNFTREQNLYKLPGFLVSGTYHGESGDHGVCGLLSVQSVSLYPIFVFFHSIARPLF